MSRALFGTILAEIRPVQWIKNLFVFAGVIFSLSFTRFLPIVQSILAFVIFCLAASSVYIFNDLIDKNIDSVHPQKRKRPIAAGKLKISVALSVSVFLAVISLFLSFLLNYAFLLTVFTYILIMIVYSLILKKIVIIDVIVISVGFVLRAMAGALAIDVGISPWLILTTFLLALFIGLSKRRYEVTLLKGNAAEHRNTLSHYSLSLLDQMIAVVTASTVVTYALYTMADATYIKFGTRLLGLTIPFVVYGIFRYLYLVHRREGGGSPEKTLLTDKPLLIDIFLWGISAIVIVLISQNL